MPARIMHFAMHAAGFKLSSLSQIGQQGMSAPALMAAGVDDTEPAAVTGHGSNAIETAIKPATTVRIAIMRLTIR
jgi:hypothetical protein